MDFGIDTFEQFIDYLSTVEHVDVSLNDNDVIVTLNYANWLIGKRMNLHKSKSEQLQNLEDSNTSFKHYFLFDEKEIYFENEFEAQLDYPKNTLFDFLLYLVKTNSNVNFYGIEFAQKSEELFYEIKDNIVELRKLKKQVIDLNEEFYNQLEKIRKLEGLYSSEKGKNERLEKSYNRVIAILKQQIDFS